MSLSKTDTALARLNALKDGLAQEAARAVQSEAEAIAALAAQRLPGAPALSIEAGADPLHVTIVAPGAVARTTEFGTRARPAQPFLLSALAQRVNAFKAALAARLAQALRNSGNIT